VVHEKLAAVEEALATVIRGKREAIRTTLIGVFGGGHVLLEDVPGVGKTTLAKAVARLLDLEFARIQFTPDLLPSDVLGSPILHPKEGTLVFQPGPVFTNVLLADEINRASPRTQSALLEAMNEEQVSVDGKARPLPAPFFVLATQNPVDFGGTFPLPEAQLDRFAVRVSLGYPDEEHEVAMMLDRRTGDPLTTLKPLLDRSEVLAIVGDARRVAVGERMARYLRRLVARTRELEELALGASPRGALALLRACQARALFEGRDHVTAEDARALVVPVLCHRVMLTQRARHGGKSVERVIADALLAEPVPS
jgi:MoxR-like ATPase